MLKHVIDINTHERESHEKRETDEKNPIPKDNYPKTGETEDCTQRGSMAHTKSMLTSYTGTAEQSVQVSKPPKGKIRANTRLETPLEWM